MNKPDQAKRERLTATGIESLLALRFAPPEYAFLLQVRGGTGWAPGAERTADALAMSLWPSRGLDLLGFEIKTDRSDWLRELKNPNKADAVAGQCDYWWVVAEKEVVDLRIDNIPAPWGLFEVSSDGKSLKVARAASKLDSPPLSRSFLAAILRRVQESIAPQAVLNQRYRAGFKDGEAAGKRCTKAEQGRAVEDAAHLRETISQFEKASGLSIERWDAGNVGTAVRLVMQGAHTTGLLRIHKIAEDIIKTIDSLPQERL